MAPNAAPNYALLCRSGAAATNAARGNRATCDATRKCRRGAERAVAPAALLQRPEPAWRRTPRRTTRCSVGAAQPRHATQCGNGAGATCDAMRKWRNRDKRRTRKPRDMRCHAEMSPRIGGCCRACGAPAKAGAGMAPNDAPNYALLCRSGAAATSDAMRKWRSRDMRCNAEMSPRSGACCRAFGAPTKAGVAVAPNDAPNAALLCRSGAAATNAARGNRATCDATRKCRRGAERAVAPAALLQRPEPAWRRTPRRTTRCSVGAAQPRHATQCGNGAAATNAARGNRATCDAMRKCRRGSEGAVAPSALLQRPEPAWRRTPLRTTRCSVGAAQPRQTPYEKPRDMRCHAEMSPRSGACCRAFGAPAKAGAGMVPNAAPNDAFLQERRREDQPRSASAWCSR